jgi:hypothetical protein
MVTPGNKVFTLAEVEEQLGGFIHTSEYNSLIGTLEKAPLYISKYGVESSSELEMIKRDKGLQIQIRNAFNDHVNFILRDEQIIDIVWGEYVSDRAIPRLRGSAVLIFIVIAFGLDGIFNKSRLMYLPLIFGLILGMVASLFSPFSRKQMVSILANVDGEDVVLIVSDVRKYEYQNFFKENYPEKANTFNEFG